KFTPTDTATYANVTTTVTLTVNPAATTITWTPVKSTIIYGDDLGAAQLNAKTGVGGTYVYSPPAGTILPVGVTTVSVTFTPTNGANYLGSSSSVDITVTPATPKITWPKPAAIKVGTPLSGTQLDATADVAGTFVYSPAEGALLPVGVQTLSVTLT